MDSQYAWNKITAELQERGKVEITTVLTTNRKPVWFSASFDGNCILVANAEQNSPSAGLLQPRLITYNDFASVADYFVQWNASESGAENENELTTLSLNSTYILALIKKLYTD
jgi:hypothetical protein